MNYTEPTARYRIATDGEMYRVERAYEPEMAWNPCSPMTESLSEVRRMLKWVSRDTRPHVWRPWRPL